MLIEYKLKFEKNGLTLTQRIEPGTSGSQGNAGTFTEENSLKASFQESKAATASGPKPGGGPGDEPGPGGHGPGDDPGPGGSGFGTAPVTIIGPFILCCPSDDSKKEGKA